MVFGNRPFFNKFFLLKIESIQKFTICWIVFINNWFQSIVLKSKINLNGDIQKYLNQNLIQILSKLFESRYFD